MSAAAAGRLLVPGRTCWDLARAHGFAAVQDGHYYRRFRDAVLAAERSIFILGWDITGVVDLAPEAAAADGAPTRLDRLIAFVARRRPALRCYILTWDYGLLYTLERDPLSRWRFGWRMPRNVRFGFDDRHPVGACHHQKIVVIDDTLAFCGGMDLTSHRWDMPAHRLHEPARVTPLGVAYHPYHEVQAMVDGPVAARLGSLVRDRWRALGADRLPPIAAPARQLWPTDLAPDLTDVDVAIARTVPGTADTPPIRERESLFLEAIARAARTIYIENQYFTSMTIAEALARRLAEPTGPEVVMVLPRRGDGWLERHTIEVFRETALRHVNAANLHDRLHVGFPMASRAHDVSTFVHSKVMIVDDVFVRIGSANLSERSLGVDTECDLAVDAGADARARAGIRGTRDRLLGEHLGLPADEVAAAVARQGSLRAVIAARSDADRALIRIDLPATPTSALPDAVRAAVDPDEPVAFGATVERLVPPLNPALGPRPMRIWLAPATVLLGAIVIATLWSESFGRTELRGLGQAIHAIRAMPSAEWIGLGVFLVAGVAMVPLEILVVAAGAVLGGWRGAMVAVAGSLAAAAIGYGAGRQIGPARIGRWMTRRSYRSGRQLGADGVAGVAVLHLAAGASAGAVHLLCGAARVPLATYLAGTTLGFGPVAVALSGFGAQLGRTLLAPTTLNAAITVATGLLLAVLAFGLRTFLLIRQFAPSLARHRARAEFG